MSFMTTEITLIHLKCTLMVLQVTQIAPEVIFVKPEVKFLSPEMALMGHLCVFNALKGPLRTQKRQNPIFCA